MNDRLEAATATLAVVGSVQSMFKENPDVTAMTLLWCAARSIEEGLRQYNKAVARGENPGAFRNIWHAEDVAGMLKDLEIIREALS